jgi:hypothetical protein
MKERQSILTLSLELRSRIEKEIIDSLVFLERVSRFEHHPPALIERVFEDFKQVNDRIWRDLDQSISLNQKKNKPNQT